MLTEGYSPAWALRSLGTDLDFFEPTFDCEVCLDFCDGYENVPTGSTNTADAPMVDLTQEFPRASLYNQNKGAEAIIKYASTQPEIHAFLLLQHVEIVAEYYDPLFDESTQFFTWSCTKSWLSLLFGIMQDEGDIEVTVALGEIWPDDYVWNGIRDGEARKAITIESLLTHTSGLQPRQDYRLCC